MLKQNYEIEQVVKRKKDTLPRLRIVLMMDSLYATVLVFSNFNDNNWDYMINFKSGNMRAVYKEGEDLMRFTPENTVDAMRGEWKQTL